MTCTSCEAKVKSALLLIPDITAVDISLKNSEAIIPMERHVALSELQKAIGTDRYKIYAENHSEAAEKAKGWFAIYKPVVILFALISAVSLLAALDNGQVHGMSWMQYFMAGFFISFSFFKLINLKGFAESYSRYDLIAGRFFSWGFIYPFVELALGLGFIYFMGNAALHVITLLVMTVSLAGVLNTVMNRRVVQCACLGVVFNLPVSTVTIMEDSLMIAMSAVMLWLI